MRHSTTKLALLLFASVILLAPQALADKSGGCNFQGSWFGVLPTSGKIFLSTAHGRSASTGTYSLEIPGFDATLGGFPGFEHAVKISTFRGTWERTGGNTFAFTLIAYAVDSDGITVGIGKVSGTDTLSEDCNSMYIENTTEVFYAGQDPFEDQPVFAIPPQPHWGYRMRVDPPYPF
ncbi:MAG: hypothetical protein GY927_02020 [bacterium]|nr:hypothetical protein [bacterium]